MKQFPPLDLKALMAPLDDRHPAGAFDPEDELFNSIDDEMIKLGGLQERSIDWAFVDEGAQRFLSHQCKHFRMAGHLIMARLRLCNWHGWADAAAVLAGMVERYWESGYLKPGAAGYLNKRRLVSQCLERLGAGLQSLDGYAENYHQAGQQALDTLHACAELTKLDVAELSRLEAKLRQHAESKRAPELVEQVVDLTAKREVVTDAFFVPLQAHPGNERENRRSLLSAAEIITRQDAYDPTGYLLRRFALWAHLTQAPSTRKANRTELMAVPKDIADRYGEVLSAGNIDPALLQKVERSVAASPYWLRGSFLSARIAGQLEMPRVAEAIRLAAERFVTRLPALAKLEFADGRPFVDGDTQAWLSGSEQGAENAYVASGLEYSAVADELRTLLASGGVEVMLRSLESLKQRKNDVRHGCHVMAIAAELLASRGLEWLAEGLYARAHSVMEGATARAWEPELFNLLARHASVGVESKN